MRAIVRPVVFAIAILATAGSVLSATPEQEQAFLDTYRTAYEGKDADGLLALVNLSAADPSIAEFYEIMLTSDMGGTITSISLRDLTPEEIDEANTIQELPNGGKAVIAPKPLKRLVVTIEQKDGDNQSTINSETFVGEVDGRIVICVAAPAP